MNSTLTGLFIINLPLADVLSAFRMSDFAGKMIVLVLFVGSIFAWSVMVTKFMELRRVEQNAEQFSALYRKSRWPLELFAQQPPPSNNPLSALYNAVCRNLARALQITSPADLLQLNVRLREYQMRALQNLAEQIMAEQALKLERQMTILATAVTAAPFLGLLGTVWGIMDAFGGLAMTGMATMSAVAPGVSGALLTTVVGLCVALPSAIGYNILTVKIRRLNIGMEHFAQEFLADIEQNCVEH